MSARNVRAYQSRGLVPPPHREGRSARYGPEHVARLRLVRALHGHGLALTQVEDLVARGIAEDELARLGREELVATWRKAVRVPMAPAYLAELERTDPGMTEALVDAGLAQHEGDRVVARATTLGLASALMVRGVELSVSARTGLAVAEAARTSAPDLRTLLDWAGGGGDPGPDVTRLLVQLAAAAYADALANELDVDEGADEGADEGPDPLSAPRR